MYKKILPCMDIKDGKVVKGVQFTSIKEAGDVLDLASYYEKSGADELALYDIGASINKKTIYFKLLSQVKQLVSMPIIAGGGLNSVEKCELTFQSGADKVSINTGAIKDKSLIKNVSRIFGKEKIILSLDVKQTNKGYEVFTAAGQKSTGINAIDWVKKAEDDGAGELIVNSIDFDGMKEGYDLNLLEKVLNSVKIPIVASGGAGKVAHFIDLFKKLPKIKTALAASVFHFKQINILKLKSALKDEGINVKI